MQCYAGGYDVFQLGELHSFCGNLWLPELGPFPHLLKLLGEILVPLSISVGCQVEHWRRLVARTVWVYLDKHNSIGTIGVETEKTKRWCIREETNRKAAL